MHRGRCLHDSNHQWRPRADSSAASIEHWQRAQAINSAVSTPYSPPLQPTTTPSYTDSSSSFIPSPSSSCTIANSTIQLYNLHSWLSLTACTALPPAQYTTSSSTHPSPRLGSPSRPRTPSNINKTLPIRSFKHQKSHPCSYDANSSPAETSESRKSSLPENH